MELVLVVLAAACYFGAFLTGVATTMLLGTRLDGFDRHYIKKLDLKEMWLMIWAWKELYIIPVSALFLGSACLTVLFATYLNGAPS